MSDNRTSSSENVPGDDGTPAVRQVLRSIRARRPLFISIILLVVGAALVYVAASTPKFTATTVVLIEPRPERVITSEDVVAGIGSDNTAVESQVALLRSIAVSPPVLQKFAIYSDPEYSRPGLFASLLGLIGRVEATETEHGDRTRRNKAIAEFERNLSVHRRENTYILEVRFTSSDPVKAANIANTIAQEYLAVQDRSREASTKKAASWLDGRIAQLRGQARVSERAVADFKAEHGIIDLGADSSGATLRKQEIDRLNALVNTARAETARQKARYIQVKAAAGQAGKTENLPEVLQSPVITSLRILFTNLKRQEIRAAATLGVRHPNLDTIRKEIRTVKGQISAETKRILASAKSSYDSALANQANLEAQLKALQTSYAKTAGQTVRLRELERNATADRRVLEQFLGRLKETTQQVSLQKPEARIVSLARVPIRPDGPGDAVILLVAFLVGIGLATGAVVIANSPEYKSTTS